MLRVNLSGGFDACKYQIAAMLQGGGGSIINMASILGAVGFANSAAYTAAKHGVLGLTKAAALEYSAQGVRVNAVGPGFIQTPMISGLEQDPATLRRWWRPIPWGAWASPRRSPSWWPGWPVTARRL